MHCKDCKYFKLYDYVYYQEKYGNENGDSIGTCKRVEYITEFRAIHKITNFNAMYSCSEWGDATEIIVGVDFGCVHFERNLKE